MTDTFGTIVAHARAALDGLPFLPPVGWAILDTSRPLCEAQASIGQGGVMYGEPGHGEGVVLVQPPSDPEWDDEGPMTVCEACAEGCVAAGGHRLTPDEATEWRLLTEGYPLSSWHGDTLAGRHGHFWTLDDAAAEVARLREAGEWPEGAEAWTVDEGHVLVLLPEGWTRR